MKEKVVIGIDTSNYTTSVSILTLDGKLLANIKRPLTVKEGERGLRQSDAVFAHIKNLPSAMNEAKVYLSEAIPVAVGVSTKPRNIEGSYMPCFLSGVAAAESISAVAKIPLYSFSHQCGHIMAALYSSSRFDLLEREFCAFHVSGGTTEVLRVNGNDYGFLAELVGGTADLNAGQVIDRIGVHMGLSFPAGALLEQLALTNTQKYPVKKPTVKDMKLNLSGLENMAVKLYSETGSRETVAAFLFDYIARSLGELATEYENRYGKSPFVFAGGVMCNTIIRKYLEERFNASFAEPQMSADNAVGIAALTSRRYKMENCFDGYIISS